MSLRAIEKIANLEKNAGALNTLFGAGKLIGKPIEAGMNLAKNVVSPFVKGTGKTLSTAGKLTGDAINAVATPAIVGGAKATGKAALGTGALAAGVGSQVATGVGKHMVAPVVKGYGNMLKKNPIGTTMGTVFGGMGLQDIYKRSSGRNFTNSPGNLQNYQNIKQRFQKVGNEMEKEAGVLDFAKKTMQHGGTLPSLLGIAGLAAIPYVAAPSLQGFGESMKRTIFPLDSRINAEEEFAKKEVGIAATHHMDNILKDYDKNKRRDTDFPKMERNLSYMIGNDSLIGEYVNNDHTKADHLRGVLQTVYDFAPDVAVNNHAAQSILRESAMSPDGGLNYNTIKLIADTQKSISGKK